MALPANLLDRLPALVRRGEPEGLAPSSLPFGIPELDAVLPDGGLPRNAVTELAIYGGSSLATTLCLAACRAARKEAAARGGEAPWCAYVDPSGTLYAPGIDAAGVDRERLLVVRPGREALERTSIRLAESQAFSVLVIDTLGVPGAPMDVALGSWLRVVRRLALSAEGSGGCILLVTDGEAQRPLPLPVAMRMELSRGPEDASRLRVRIAKERQGRVAAPRIVQWGAVNESRPKTLKPRLCAS
jgi:recombination protein RecA